MLGLTTIKTLFALTGDNELPARSVVAEQRLKSNVAEVRSSVSIPRPGALGCRSHRQTTLQNYISNLAASHMWGAKAEMLGLGPRTCIRLLVSERKRSVIRYMHQYFMPAVCVSMVSFPCSKNKNSERSRTCFCDGVVPKPRRRPAHTTPAIFSLPRQ